MPMSLLTSRRKALVLMAVVTNPHRFLALMGPGGVPWAGQRGMGQMGGLVWERAASTQSMFVPTHLLGVLPPTSIHTHALVHTHGHLT